MWITFVNSWERRDYGKLSVMVKFVEKVEKTATTHPFLHRQKPGLTGEEKYGIIYPAAKEIRWYSSVGRAADS